MKECNITANLKNCTCSYEPCSRKGKCCECVLYHRKNGQIPGCFFPPDKEKLYNRSIEFFISIFKQK
ncbi:MAG: DUF6485 family protein [Elusimicrobiota bacterium]|nr:DUF6485 family protein [Endomicrobiia bacterium]MCX7910163.1 DUF6485 family protein [Endomicrobiia bacterium]MDW8165342.1 DUF6485 family protein [Elusimicrobiota bacterium]